MYESTTVNFSVEPEWLTSFVRDLWAEGRYALALDTMDCLIGLERIHKVGVIKGTHKLIDGNFCVADVWQPDLDRCAFGQYPDPDKLEDLAEKGANLQRDVRRLEDAVVGLIKGQMQSRSAGEALGDLEYMLKSLVSKEALGRNDIEERVILHTQPNARRLVYGNLQDGYTTRVGFAAGLTGRDMREFFDRIPDVEDYVQHQLELDKTPLPSPDVDYISENGYIVPDGRYYPCGWMEHMWLASRIEEILHVPEALLLKVARSQITPDMIGVYLPSDDYEPTVEQLGTVVLWCSKHNVNIPDWATTLP